MNTKRMSKRKCEMWISNNKVLVGGNKKPHARNPNFETEETRLLISLWGDPKIQKTLITTHKKHPVIMQLADQMREHGYFRSADEINTRIKNLKCFYNRIKKDVEMGIITEPTWKHYGAMDEIVTRPVFGNRVQQPHLQHLQQQQAHSSSSASGAGTAAGGGTGGGGGGSDVESADGLRPEDLLSVKEDEEADVDFEGASLVPKDEPVDMDEMAMDQSNSMEEDVNDIFPKLSQYLQLAAAASAKGCNKSVLKLADLAGISHQRGLTQIPSPPLEMKSSPPSSPEPDRQNYDAKGNGKSTKPSPAATPNAQLLSALSLAPAIVPATTAATIGQGTATAGSSAVSSRSSSSASPSPLAALASTTTTTTTTVSSTTTTLTPTPVPNKISLVPTNILMKPKVTPSATSSAAATTVTPAAVQQPPLTSMPAMVHNPHQPQSISFGGEQYVCANQVSNGKSVYTSQQKDGQPMKVLLVNTIQKPMPQVTVPAGNMLLASGSASVQPSTLLPQPSVITMPQPMLASATSAAHHMAPSKSIATIVCNSSSSSNSTSSPIPLKISSISSGNPNTVVINTPTSQTMATISAAAAATAQSVSSLTQTLRLAPAASIFSARAAAQRTSAHNPLAAAHSAGPAAIASVVADMEGSTSATATAAAAAAAAAAASAKLTASSRKWSAAAAARAAKLEETRLASGGGGGGALRSGRRPVVAAAAAASVGSLRASQAGFRSLLQQLITLQTETLATTRQRLELDQKRLSFEQTMGDKLLTALQALAPSKRRQPQ